MSILKKNNNSTFAVDPALTLHQYPYSSWMERSTLDNWTVTSSDNNVTSPRQPSPTATTAAAWTVHRLLAGTPTPYKPWTKCSIIEVRKGFSTLQV